MIVFGTIPQEKRTRFYYAENPATTKKEREFRTAGCSTDTIRCLAPVLGQRMREGFEESLRKLICTRRKFGSREWLSLYGRRDTT